MNEQPPQAPKTPSNEGKKNEWEHKAEFLALARELSQSPEAFPFPGVNPKAYAEIKAEDEKFPGFTPTIGMRGAISPAQPNEAGILIMPKNSSDGDDDLNENSLMPNHLNSEGIQDEKLKRLIELIKGKYTERDPQRSESTPPPRMKPEQE